MGTNYYLKRDVCSHCGRGESPLHIGKSSGGWAFLLHVEPEAGLNSLDDYERMFLDPKNRIEDEYGRTLTPEEMLSEIKDRRGKVGEKPPSMFYKSMEEMLEKNYAVLAPEYGLLRCDRSRPSSRCVGHGDGPWDLVTGEFS